MSLAELSQYIEGATSPDGTMKIAINDANNLLAVAKAAKVIQEAFNMSDCMDLRKQVNALAALDAAMSELEAK